MSGSTRLTRSAAPLLLLFLFAADAEAVIRRAFVTSVSGTGDFSTWPDNGGLTGLAAANKICQNRAAASSQSIPSPGRYRAFVSTDGPGGTDAYCNVLGLTGLKSNSCNGTAPLPQAGPWRMSNGFTYWAHELRDIVDSSPEIVAPLARDENFANLPDYTGSKYWTGSSQYGTTAVDQSCDNWTTATSSLAARVGSGFGTAQRFADAGPAGCDTPRRLLCLESGPDVDQPPVTAVGSLVFVTSESLSADLGSEPLADGAKGVAAGDNICRNLAAEARLPSPSSFFALLGSASIDPADRITAPGPFLRLDGFVVAHDEEDLFDGTTDNTIHQTETGAYLSHTTFVHTGADAAGMANGSDCEGWTSDSVEVSGSRGDAGLARSERWVDVVSLFACPTLARLYCFSNRVVLFWESFELTHDLARWSEVSP